MAELPERDFATEGDCGGLEEYGGRFGVPGVSDSAEPQLFQEFFEDTFEVVGVEPCTAFVASPEIKLPRTGQRDGYTE